MKILLKILCVSYLAWQLTGCAFGPYQYPSLGTAANASHQQPPFDEKQPNRAPDASNIGAMVNKYPGCDRWCHNHWCSIHCGSNPY